MSKIRAAITGVGGYVPDYILTNHELSTMVDTSDEWIMQRIGIRERRILKDKGRGTSDMGVEAVKDLLRKTGTKPDEIDMILCATITPDMCIPNTACLIAHKLGTNKPFCFDLSAACSGFLYGLETCAKYVESGKYKKVLLVAADKMSAITDYTDRNTCPLFGDGAAAVLIEPVTEELGVMDCIMRSDGIGYKYLFVKAGGSLYPATHETVDAKMHYMIQDGQTVFKYAVSNMADVSVEIMKRNNLKAEDIAWLVPHQANMRIIDATARRMGMGLEKVMINIERYGNTTAATIPLCLWEWEKRLKKGDNVVLVAFGAGFTWGSLYMKWAYNS